MAPRLLPGEDVSVSQALTESFERHGIQICTGIGGIERIEETDGARAVHYRHDEQARTIHAEIVVMAVGWPGNIEALNLSVAGVYAEKGYIPVNDALQTSAPHIFAAGDITGRMMLVQSAGDEARIAAENAVLGTGRCGHPQDRSRQLTDPEYGSVGLTEEEARKQEECAVAVVPTPTSTAPLSTGAWTVSAS